MTDRSWSTRATDRSWLVRRGQSFRCAGVGVMRMLRTQAHARIHAVATVGIVVAGVVLHISSGQWCAIILSAALVWALEAVNSAFEQLCDVAQPDFCPMVAAAKDMAAGAVLVAAVGAAAVGVVVFGSHLW